MTQVNISKRAAVVIAVALLLVIPGVAGATHIFTDVTDGNVHAPGVEWVANAGVTSGCGDGSTYCPNDPVTRAQMATFMHRLSGHAPGIDPSVNADQVDGFDLGDIVRIYGEASDTPIDDFTSFVFTDILSDTVTAPVDGFLHITGSVSAEADTTLGGVGGLGLMITLDGAALWGNADAWYLYTNAANAPFGNSASFTVVVPAAAGNHTVALQAREQSLGSFIEGRSLSTIFVASGEGVAVPFGDAKPGSDTQDPNR